MEDRLHNIRTLLQQKNLDGILISSQSNVVYISHYAGFSRIERDGYILITRESGYILTSALYAEAIRRSVPHLTLCEYSGVSPFLELLQKLVEKHSINRLGYEPYDLTVSEWTALKKLKRKLSSIDLHSIRMIKSSVEIQHVQTASEIADTALKKIMPDIRPGITENEMVYNLETELRQVTADVAFPTIVAFGKNAAIPHHKSDTTRLKQNDVVLVDFGAVSQEYRSDMTRTFFVGKATGEQRQVYDAVRTAQQSAVNYVTATLKSERKIQATEVDRVARAYLESLGYPSIPHSLGHGIGLDVHEAPRLSPVSRDTLTEGMIFSIEPGVYFPGKFGVRIEDLYAIQKGKLIQLTHAPSHLIELK